MNDSRDLAERAVAAISEQSVHLVGETTQPAARGDPVVLETAPLAILTSDAA